LRTVPHYEDRFSINIKYIKEKKMKASMIIIGILAPLAIPAIAILSIKDRLISNTSQGE
jgi:hypothetical protein